MKYITFTVPSYNSESYMRRCIDSLLVGGEDVEILIIDDGSTDKTGAIADEYEMLYPNIVKAVHKPNGGHGSGVNKGLELAQGIYYKVVDSDDWLNQNACLALLDRIRHFAEDGESACPDLFICNYVYDHLDEGIQKPMIPVPDYACVNVPHTGAAGIWGKIAGAYVLCGQPVFLSTAPLCEDTLLHGS